MYPTSLQLFVLFASIAAAAGLGAREKLDLNRLTPVPEHEPVPIMDFFRPKVLQQPQLNRAGTHIAALVNAGDDRQQLMVYCLADQTIKTLGGKGDKDIYSFAWLDDQRLLYMVSTEKLYALGMMAVDINFIHESYPLLQYYGARLVGIPERNRNHPIVWMRHDFMNENRDLGVAEIDAQLRIGEFVNLMVARVDYQMFQEVEAYNERHILKRYAGPAGGLVNGYATDHRGELGFAFTGDGEGFLSLHQYVPGKDTWTKSPLDLEELDFISAGDRSGEVIVRGARVTGKARPLYRTDALTGEPGQMLLQDQRYDFDGWLFRDEVTREIVGAKYNRGGPTSVWFDEGYRQAQKVIESSFPGLVVNIIDGDRTGRLLVSTQSDRQPVVYHWVDLSKRAAGLIKNSAPWIEAKRLQPMRVTQYKTRDGHVLDAYVTLPATASEQSPAPLVVLPHGGPWVRDSWGFDAEVQFLASRGYAVLQPNYRGSAGYDWMFPEEELYDFVKMHEDVTDATKAVLTTGLIDRDRVAIMGSSFGAYLALAGVVREPALYRCAVAIAGVFDWESVMKDMKYDQFTSSSYAYMKRKLGDPRQQKEKYDAISPVRHVDQVRVPVFVSHGTEDFIAYVGESRRLIGELKKHGVPYESLIVSREGHGMQYLKNEVELYGRVEAFLEKHLGSRAAAVATSGAAP